MDTESLSAGLRETFAVFEGSSAPLTTTEVAERLDMGRRSTYDRLDRLVDRGYLETKKVGSSGRVWWTPDPSRPVSSLDSLDGSGSTDDTVPFDTVFDRASVGVFVLDPNFRIAWANAAVERYFGIDRAAVVGGDKRDLVDGTIRSIVDESTSVDETILPAYEEGSTPEGLEIHVSSGEHRSERWLEYHSTPIESGPYAGGRIETYYDVTDRKRSRASFDSERFQSLVDAVDEYGVFMLDSQGRTRTWNSGAERIKGYRREEILGEHVSTFYTDEDRAAGVPEANLRAAESEGVVEDEGWRVRADGSTFWAHVTITAIRDDDGSMQGYAQVTRDLTGRRERAREIDRERNLLNRILETSPIGIAILNPDRRIVRANGRAEHLLGLTRSEIEGRTYDEPEWNIWNEDGDPVDATDHPVTHVLETGEPVLGFTHGITLSDGTERWLSSNAAPVFDDAGEIERVVVALEDITQLKEQARRLERQRDDLKAELDDVFARVRDGVIGLDTELRFTYVNERAADLLERSAGTLIGEHIWDALEPGPKAREALERALDAQERLSFEEYYEPLDTWFENYVYPSETGVSVYFRDVTERKQRERELEESERRYRTLVDNFPNGAVALFDEDLRYLIVGGTAFEGLEFEASDLVGDRLSERLPDQLLDAMVPRYRAAFEGESSEFEVEFDGEIRQFRVVPVTDEDGSVFAGMATSQDVTRQRKRQQELEHQREQLTALNNLHDIVRDITEAVLDQSTRDEIEAIVCDRLAASDSYSFAWIGDVDVQTRTVNLRTEAGVEGYLDGVTISTDPDDDRSQGPTGLAILEREVQVTQDVRLESSHDPWRDHVRDYGFRSSAAIPILHDDTLYGVLNVYADRPNAFTDDEQAVISQLGEIIGHAIATLEQRRALMSEEVVELEFQIQSVFDVVGLPVETDDPITLDRAVPVGDGAFLQYGTTTEAGLDVVRAAVESEALPFWSSMSVLETDGEETRFELRMSEPPIISTVATHGGYVDDARIEGGNYYLRVHLAPSTDVSRVVDRITDAYPEIELLVQRQVTRNRTATGGLRGTFLEDLTERQRSAIEAAFYAGYFAWPRESTGETVAESLGVSPPTFHQHLRKAEHKLLASLLEDDPSGG
jgi:PAS domain S-box-containing protein